MPNPTNTERIQGLADVVADHRTRISALENELAQAKVKMADQEGRIKLLEHIVEELRKGGEEWGRRGWTAAVAVVAAGLGALVTYLLRR